MKYQSVVFIRCHDHLAFCLDTLDSIEYYCDRRPFVCFTVDHNVTLCNALKKARPDIPVFMSKSKVNWGGSLHRLFCQATTWLLEELRIDFDYLWNMDYDAIFIQKDVDLYYQDKFLNPKVGQVGKVIHNAASWKRGMKRSLPTLRKLLAGINIPFPADYKAGHATAGALSVLRSRCVYQMWQMGLLKAPASDVCDLVSVTDDPLLSFFVKVAGYDQIDIGRKCFLVWTMSSDYKTVSDKGCNIFHPTKLNPGFKGYSYELERDCRNYFRGLREAAPLPAV